MTVKEWKEELKYYEEDAEVIFEICDDVKCESWTEGRYGAKSVYLNTRLKPTFICGVSGDCNVELGVSDE